MTRLPREHIVGLLPLTKARKTVDYHVASEALLGAIVALSDVHGQITSFRQEAGRILHIRFEDGTVVDIAATLRHAPAVRDFLVRAMRAVN